MTDGVIHGPWQTPGNIAADAVGSIHHDATAQALGLRGGTVAGSIHMEQFQRLLWDAWGEPWRQAGTLSLFFLHPTVDREPVRCGFKPLSEGRAEVWMETETGARVGEGTASLGPDPDSALHRRLREVRPAKDLRMLAGVHVGDEGVLGSVRTPQGEPVLPANALIDAFRLIEPAMISVDGPYVGLYGALQLEALNGGPRPKTDYRLTGRVLALSESPKTEVIWYEATLHGDAGPVARHLHMSRLLKASSPLWAPPGVS